MVVFMSFYGVVMCGGWLST